VTKPFAMLQLLARIETLLRRIARTATTTPLVFQFGPVQVDFRKNEVLRNGDPVVMSAKEFQLLRYLIEHRDETVTRVTLLQEVWGYTSTPYTRTVDVHVAWLRQKLEHDPRQPRYIQTVHGIGYKFSGQSTVDSG
jgi:two-component system, OmpR family, alkaline phosphatase synthesis response regulator PhoP